jgi:hypothetical protein
VERDEVIDAGTLPAIEMPNEGNFYWAYAEGSSAR